MTVNTENISKGDTVLYEFGYCFVEAEVIKVYGKDFIKVRHIDFPLRFLKFMGLRHVINVNEVLSIEKRGK